MRIRKRFLCLSAVITSPKSPDLLSGNHNHRQPPVSTVQQQELHPNGNQHAGHDNTIPPFSDHPNQCHRSLPPSATDHITQIRLQPSASGDCSDQNKTKIFKELEPERKIESIIKDDDDTGCRKESILCVEANNNHDHVLNGWLHGDRLVPVKKKRGSHGRILNNDVVHDNKMIDRTIKSRRPKKNEHKLLPLSLKNMKNEKREDAIAEGSRCSRVNGRGWRCSQQTLVGYSLCEHHLGKGRLRNMANVRGAKTVALKEQHTKNDDDQDDDDDDVDDGDDDDEFKDWDVLSMEGTKVFSKKMKIGVVKARSLSSLMSQIDS